MSRDTVTPVVVTLIHGTWARRARWTDRSSPLSQALLQIPHVRDIVRFEWSGRNSHWARIKAAKRLAEHHETVTHKHPGCRHYVIAHSHGGNVALYACRWYRKTIGGIACLSTPFLHVQERPELPVPMPVCLSLVVTIQTALLLGIFTALAWMNVWAVGPMLAFMIHVGVMALTYLGVVKLVFYGDDGVRGGMSIGGFAPENTNLLIIRQSGDEATASLAMAHFVGWLSERSLLLIGWIPLLPARLLMRLFARSRRASVPFVAVAVFLACLGLLGTLVVDVLVIWWLEIFPPAVNSLLGMLVRPLLLPLYGGPTYVRPLTVIMVASLALAAGILLVGFLAILVSATLHLTGFAFGVYDIFNVFPAPVTAEASPSGRWVVHQPAEEVPDVALRDLFAVSHSNDLVHSGTYSAPSAIHLLTEWICDEPVNTRPLGKWQRS